MGRSQSARLATLRMVVDNDHLPTERWEVPVNQLTDVNQLKVIDSDKQGRFVCEHLH